MSQVVTFKCPSCGGYLEFDPALQKFRCLYCSQIFTDDDLREQSEQREAEAEAVQQAEKTSDAGEAASQGSRERLRSYNCQMCGAQIVTDETTAATRCYFCHSPVVLYDRLDDDFRPDGVIPFKMNREQAKEAFMKYISKKHFVDKQFFDEGQLEMFTGVYYPYWYFDVDGIADFSGEGSSDSIGTTPNYIVTTTRYYSVKRRARMAFRNIARKALKKVDGQLSDGIHPYPHWEVKEYASGYLSGFLAERRDLEAQSHHNGLMDEIKSLANTRMHKGVALSRLQGITQFHSEQIRSRYVLLPTWVLTWKGGKNDTLYYYLMNGSTGKVCGKLPIDRKKLIGFAVLAGLIIFGIMCLGGKFIW